MFCHFLITLIHSIFEYENNDSIHFLDILINRSAGTFLTSVYRKLTFTGLLTNFISFIPLTYKKGLIYSLLNRFFAFALHILLFFVNLRSLKVFSSLMPFLQDLSTAALIRFFTKFLHLYLNLLLLLNISFISLYRLLAYTFYRSKLN